MRYFDINNHELQESDIDLENGYLEEKEIFKEHHSAIEETPEKFHYKVDAVYFNDNTVFVPETEDDPHIKINDAKLGLFQYQSLEEEDRQVTGIEISKVIDVPWAPGQNAWDEY